VGEVSEPRDRLEELEAAAALERTSLVRLCARITGDPDAAEDLAQETLLEALRNAHKLHDLTGRPQWLAAIARNVCLRWARKRGRELSRMAQVGDSASDLPEIDDWPADDFDLEMELERRELVELLDRALALLPAETRDVLVHRYVHESPHAEIAARLQVTEQAVWMRLNRGKLLLLADRREVAIILKSGCASTAANCCSSAYSPRS
jgi:RNA polymerase sigma-70 factor (ECF subfamily)